MDKDKIRLTIPETVAGEHRFTNGEKVVTTAGIVLSRYDGNDDWERAKLHEMISPAVHVATLVGNGWKIEEAGRDWITTAEAINNAAGVE